MGNALKRMVFQPPSPPTYECDASFIWLTTRRRQRIPAFFIDIGASLTIIFSHGNAEDIGMVIEYFKEVSRLWNCNFFVYDYVGYGHSTGKPSEQGVYDSVEAAFEYLTLQLGLPASSIVVYGRSLGTGASCHLASRHRLAGMILQSGLTSIHRVGLNTRFSLPGDMFEIDLCSFVLVSTRAGQYPLRCLDLGLSSHLSTCRFTNVPPPQIYVPISVDLHRLRCVYLDRSLRASGFLRLSSLQGDTSASIVSNAHAFASLQELYNRCPLSVTPYWVEGGGHNNLELLGRRTFYENVARFLKFVRARETPGVRSGPLGSTARLVR